MVVVFSFIHFKIHTINPFDNTQKTYIFFKYTNTFTQYYSKMNTVPDTEKHRSTVTECTMFQVS